MGAKSKLERFYLDPDSGKIIYGLSKAVLEYEKRKMVFPCSICHRAFNEISELIVHKSMLDHFSDEKSNVPDTSASDGLAQGIVVPENHSILDIKVIEISDDDTDEEATESGFVPEGFANNKGRSDVNPTDIPSGTLELKSRLRKRHLRFKDRLRREKETPDSTVRKTDPPRHNKRKVSQSSRSGSRISRSLMLRHVASFHCQTSTQYTCGVCMKVLTTKYVFFKHEALHQLQAGQKELKCPYCSKILTCKETARVHVRSEHNQGSFRCLLCEKYVVDTFGMEKKERFFYPSASDPTKKSVVCTVCNSRLATTSNLKRHMNTVHSTFPTDRVKCPKCHVTYSSRDSLKRHMKSVHA